MPYLRILPVMLIAIMLGTTSTPAFAAGKVHKVAIHVDENDKGRMNLVLNNAKNVDKYYQSKGDKVEIEIVAYGPWIEHAA